MVNAEHTLALLTCTTEHTWCEKFYGLGRQAGFEQAIFGVVPNRQTPLESAFLRSSVTRSWLETYHAKKHYYVDPTVRHSLTTALPIIWSPNIFKTSAQRQLYGEACDHGITSGISFPMHGANGEFGVVSFISDARPGAKFTAKVSRALPQLALIRDYAFESSLRFIRAKSEGGDNIAITAREMECLKWTMEGKSSWEIAKILACSEATINFHMANIRRKFEVGTRRQAVIKAIRLGIISPT